MLMLHIRTLCLLALILLAGCVPGRAGIPAPQNPSGQDTANVSTSEVAPGRVYQVSTGQWVSEEALLAELERADIVLIGERHDHPEHHAIQAGLLRAMIDAGRRPAVTFEMIRADMQTDLEEHVLQNPEDIAGLGAVLDWEKRGWPAWNLYAPLFTAAVDAGLSIVGADMPAPMLAELRQHGKASLDPQWVERTGLERVLTVEDKSALAEEIMRAHCGHANPAMIEAMTLIQQVRDAHLAERTYEAASDERGAVLIAGNGHVRSDRGVPRYLMGMTPDVRAVSIGLVEADPERRLPVDYRLRNAEGAPVYDYVRFTELLDSEDPCVRYQEQLRKMRERAGGPAVGPAVGGSDVGAEKNLEP
jgi:uncharacterized iron-regulated protein